ncbi:hypothetical protein [Microbacterium sp. MRS-1]|uniref:hypothetical protein n=1 Tax=Microbacterium sp. MRS-1 TaxID=1451261 RepID=UPI0004BA3BB4|nr:hypothetical protein [Microbacterium sp. MRS-1]
MLRVEHQPEPEPDELLVVGDDDTNRVGPVAARARAASSVAVAPSANATITVSECATTSCISRAMRARSAAAACSACCERSAHS